VLALSVVPATIYWDTVYMMASHWSSEAYRHCYLIPFISVLLLWRDRAKYGSVPVSGSWVGAVFLLILVALWIVAEATSVQLVAHLSVVLMIGAFVLTVLGWRAYSQMWFPLAFLLFAVPVGDTVIPFLMNSTTSIALAALKALGVPALREGMLVTLPGGTFEVVEACSGLNYLNAGLALGVLVAYLMFEAAWKRVAYVVAVIVVFVLVNGVRAFTIMFVGSASKMQVLVGREHIFFGWILFLAAMALMYWIAEKYSDVRELEPSRASQ